MRLLHVGIRVKTPRSGQMTSHKGYNEPGPIYLIGPSCTRLALCLIVLRSSVPPFLLASSPFPVRSPRRSSSLVVSLVPFFATVRPAPARRLVAQARVCASSLSIQTPGPGTVEIIKRRPAFGATSGIRVGALYSRHYPPRKLGRDETAFLSLSLSLSVPHRANPPLCLSCLLPFFLSPWQ